MASSIFFKGALFALAGAVAACGSLAPRPIPQPEPDDGVADVPASSCHRGAQPATIDTYKIGAARHILRWNLGHTFDGHLPPMLPAIVVVRLSVDGAGRLADVAIERARDDTAADAALASIRRSGAFPLPCALIVRPHGTLTFSETFLFNSQYQFQLRSLADPQ